MNWKWPNQNPASTKKANFQIFKITKIKFLTLISSFLLSPLTLTLISESYRKENKTEKRKKLMKTKKFFRKKEIYAEHDTRHGLNFKCSFGGMKKKIEENWFIWKFSFVFVKQCTKTGANIFFSFIHSAVWMLGKHWTWLLITLFMLRILLFLLLLLFTAFLFVSSVLEHFEWLEIVSCKNVI